MHTPAYLNGFPQVSKHVSPIFEGFPVQQACLERAHCMKGQFTTVPLILFKFTVARLDTCAEGVGWGSGVAVTAEASAVAAASASALAEGTGVGVGVGSTGVGVGVGVGSTGAGVGVGVGVGTTQQLLKHSALA